MRRVLLVTTLWGLGTGASAVAAQWLLRRQARVARGLIGKPFGEQAHMADKTYKKKHGEPIELLLLGDSIAAGLGADKPKHTLGAQLARKLAVRTHRAVRLYTAAHVGSETSMLRPQLAALPEEYVPDVAVIVVGGNDVTHRIKPTVSRDHLIEAVQTLRARGTAVVVGTCPDLSTLAALPQPLRSLAGIASRQLASVQREAVIEVGGLAVSLADIVGPFFLAQPDAMFAMDRFHPSSAGYRRTAKAILPSVLVALGYEEHLPFGHVGPARTGGSSPDRNGTASAR